MIILFYKEIWSRMGRLSIDYALLPCSCMRALKYSGKLIFFKLDNIPSLTVYIVKKPCKSLKSSGLQSFFLCYQMCVQIFIF